MEFQFSYFKSWKMMLWQCCTQYASKFRKPSSGQRTEKGQFSFQSLRKAIPKNAQTTTQLHSSHTLVKCLKFSKLSFSNMWTMNFQIFKLVLEKAEEPEIKLPTSAGSSKKSRRVLEKHPFLLYWLCQSLCVNHKKCGKFWKWWEYQITWPASWEICMQVREQQFELDMGQQTGSK